MYSTLQHICFALSSKIALSFIFKPSLAIFGKSLVFYPFSKNTRFIWRTGEIWAVSVLKSIVNLETIISIAWSNPKYTYTFQGIYIYI